MIEKILSYLGMARRAGKIVSGEFQVETMLKKNKGQLLILACDAPSGQRKYEKWAGDHNIPVIIIGTKQELGIALGLSPRSVILVMDEGFAKAILKARS
ncbi:MAG: L7Ae/L30e/S12e/Gadd45 family ribosomal protein [Desulfitobacteriaceae bacterium]|nr:L7Ae/L30e/S12e/Gadd45 family ribosomal protein [Desulfitobacteriaceae bacterium]MDD4345590.1 L7Ae/L30e/S12e/Gadd45 family ribosomal protein [Desulfitobacteriaceae bacterium]MDD4401526.1 L7Ae/L30e/S12e/Gadd45 family ribosomal protein [Desulfitobacteriaceae bacterium]